MRGAIEAILILFPWWDEMLVTYTLLCFFFFRSRVRNEKEAGNSVHAAKLSDGLFKRQVGSIIIKAHLFTFSCDLLLYFKNT